MAKVNKRHQLASSLAGFTTSFIFYCGKSQHLARNTPSTVKQHSGFSLEPLHLAGCFSFFPVCVFFIN